MNLLASFNIAVGGKTYLVNNDWQYDFDAPYNSVEMVLQNIIETITTPLGSLVFFRSYGTDWDLIDQPGNAGSMQAQVAVVQACARWEPRAKFLRILLTPASADNLLAGVYDLYCELEIDLSQQISAALYGLPGPVSYWVVNGDFSSSALPVVEQVPALM